jgi:hypothetical protein
MGLPGVMRDYRNVGVPSAGGGIARLACALAEKKGACVGLLLQKSGLSRNQIEDGNARLEVQSQIKFLELVAETIGDDLLGFHLSQNFDPADRGFVILRSRLIGQEQWRIMWGWTYR